MHYSASLNFHRAFLAESLPVLEHVPNISAPWKRTVKAQGKLQVIAKMELMDMVRADVAEA